MKVSEGPVNVWTVNPPAVVFAPPAAKTLIFIVGASFTSVTEMVKAVSKKRPPVSVARTRTL